MTGPGGLNLTKSDQITVDLGPHTLLGYTHDPGVHALGLHDH